MPLYKTINFSQTTQILVWKITESYEQLFSEVQLNEKSLLRLNNMKSQLHQRAFLSVRKLLQQVGYSDFNLYYDQFGKPHLHDGKHISISHSHEFSSIIISDQKAGIDIEMQREKIISIADKFVNNKDSLRLGDTNIQDYIKKLTVKWGAKEAIFKIRNEPGISFKNHIWVNSFEIKDKKTIAILEMGNIKQQFSIYFEDFEGFILVYAFEK
ncbi:4'-phosphopantetheinyl transferase family protein [Flavobacterium soyangense]|uniref:4'-phosphopantetheinyl transferase superfamily protein n=1 Tax=Flavobacterium soyangense TaxID=2023265 RepID=A0A930U8I0_9FLAO|nr:4'-phosphopantetheinyl transferase superfamily protein [Flavobacterium soyangense]MBF2708883.1 4'-phosphopantetheinyl transferase superfamily protein [Flavobacterium soyangense]